MPSVTKRPGESDDSLFRRFKRSVDRSGIYKVVREKQYFVPGSVMKQKRLAAAKKRWNKYLSRLNSMFVENYQNKSK